jgi:hypothetical protein
MNTRTDAKRLAEIVERATDLYRQGQFEASIRAYSRALKADPDNATIAYNRGVAFT